MQRRVRRVLAARGVGGRGLEREAAGVDTRSPERTGGGGSEWFYAHADGEEVSSTAPPSPLFSADERLSPASADEGLSPADALVGGGAGKRPPNNSGTTSSRRDLPLLSAEYGAQNPQPASSSLMSARGASSGADDSSREACGADNSRGDARDGPPPGALSETVERTVSVNIDSHVVSCCSPTAGKSRGRAASFASRFGEFIDRMKEKRHSKKTTSPASRSSLETTSVPREDLEAGCPGDAENAPQTNISAENRSRSTSRRVVDHSHSTSVLTLREGTPNDEEDPQQLRRSRTAPLLGETSLQRASSRVSAASPRSLSPRSLSPRSLSPSELLIESETEAGDDSENDHPTPRSRGHGTTTHAHAPLFFRRSRRNSDLLRRSDSSDGRIVQCEDDEEDAAEEDAAEKDARAATKGGSLLPGTTVIAVNESAEPGGPAPRPQQQSGTPPRGTSRRVRRGAAARPAPLPSVKSRADFQRDFAAKKRSSERAERAAVERKKFFDFRWTSAWTFEYLRTRRSRLGWKQAAAGPGRTSATSTRGTTPSTSVCGSDLDMLRTTAVRGNGSAELVGWTGLHGRFNDEGEHVCW